MADIPLLIVSDNAVSERRVSLSWTVTQLKGRLEPITGIPASCQRLILKIGSQTPQAIEALDEDSTQLERWSLQAYAEIQVGDSKSSSSFLMIASLREFLTVDRCYRHSSRAHMRRNGLQSCSMISSSTQQLLLKSSRAERLIKDGILPRVQLENSSPGMTLRRPRTNTTSSL